ncbi:uncharacterized protein PHALS_10841 [Plasmopara halstedii]|uniref:Uncharacterized protein n=1 Tax=Plasmopara halstedii TaxID=4781 RepID=A0A0P1AHD7_PLAHL|nr:uncharacterized protein PHALS_10841 [Plasmopara halstedii]CEG40655.1 hypothetical protein PHALS_10841 [Plasmopara halstedii]|eukprot:XP_024577024.1 hypothetical protein PHALS_10841 [Plasmopara halstedii]
MSDRHHYRSRRPSTSSSPHQRHSRKTRSRSKSRSASFSASSKRIRHHDPFERELCRRHEEHAISEGAEKQKLDDRKEDKQRLRVRNEVEYENEDNGSFKSSDRKSTNRSHRHDSFHINHRPHSCSSSSLSNYESDRSDGLDVKRSRYKRKREHSSLKKDKKRRSKEKKTKEKKSKKSKKSSNKSAVNQNEYGKFGILRESDIHRKSVSFQAWLRDVKKQGEFNGPKWEAMELFKEYMEDYNTCTLPHVKYYDIERYELKQYQKKQDKARSKHGAASDKVLGMVADEERVRRDRQAMREQKEQEDFRLVMQLMDKDKINAMREQERLRSQMQMFYKSGNVEEARRLEQLLNKVNEDPRIMP